MADPRIFRSHTVWTRQHWTGAWVQQSHVYCDNILWTCGPDFNRADLSYTYGTVQNFGSPSIETNAKLDLTNYYVKIIVTQTDGTEKTWYGIIVDTERFQYGNGFNDTVNPVSSIPEVGKQKFTAVGLEYLLEREMYVTSVVKYNDGSGVVSEFRTQRGIAFNMGGGDEQARRIVGNMDGFGEKGVSVFCESLPGTEWNARDIIDYLLTYHAPKDAAGNDLFGWQLSFEAKANATLYAIIPKLDAHGMSIKNIIDSLLDRRRIISWYVDVDEAAGKVEVQVFTFNSENIDLDTGGTIAANIDTVEIDLADDPRLLSAPYTISSTSQYDRVIARGAPVTLTLSLQETPSTGQGHLIRDWTDANVTSYNAAASGDAGYPADDEGKIGWNAAYRHSPAMERVFRYFLWNPDKVFLDIPGAEAEINGNEPFLWPPGGRFLNVIPLKFDSDYTSISTSISSTKPTVSVDEYMRPMAFLKDGTRYFSLHHLDFEKPTDDMLRTWGGSLRMRHDQLGFAVDIHGAPQHVIAADEFTPLSVDVTPYDGISPSDTGRLRWQTMIVTVAVELDNFAESVWPDIPVGAGKDFIQTLYISVPERRMEYVAANTVFGIATDGTLKKNSTGGWITDDSKKLEWIARIAYEWYSIPHRAFEYQFRSLDVPYHVGQLVTSLITTDSQNAADKTLETMNSAVTAIALDMRAGAYTLKTSFADFDVRGAVL